MFIKEKIVENKIFKDKNSKLTKQDKDDILNKIIDKTNLQVEEKPSLRRKVNLKVVYALACSVVICVLGFVGIKLATDGQLVDPNYRGKQVELLGLDEDDVCLGYYSEISSKEIEYINKEFDLSIVYENNYSKYIVYLDENYFLCLEKDNKIDFYKIQINITSKEIINKFNIMYNTNINEVVLNDNKSGFLFLIKEEGIEFYTEKNNVKNSIFVEFE